MIVRQLFHASCRIALLVSLSLTVVGCGSGDSPTDPSLAVAGTYTLTAVNGSPPPVTVVSVPGYALRVNGGSLIINTDKTWSNTTTVEVTESGQTTTQTLTCTGTYTQNGPSLTLVETTTNDCGGSFTANWDQGDSIIVGYNAGLRAVYTR